MKRFICKLALALLLAFAGLAAAVRSLAYDGAYFERVRAFFASPPDCPAPCLFGIRPGVTPADSAPGILAAYPWITGLTVVDWQMVSTSIDWNRSPQPAALATWSGDTHVLVARVYAMTFTTDIPFGVLWLALGRPALGSVDHTYHVAGYPERGFYIRTAAACYNYWREPVIVVIHVWTPSFGDYGPMRSRICRQGSR